MKLTNIAREQFSRIGFAGAVIAALSLGLAISRSANAQMAKHDARSGAGESVYLDVTVEEKDPLAGFTSIEIGPCQWSVDGRQYDNSMLKIRNLFVSDLSSAPEPDGYKVALRCKDHVEGVFDVQLGFGKNLTPAQLLGSNEIFEGTINDTTVFLSFRVKVGNRR